MLKGDPLTPLMWASTTIHLIQVVCKLYPSHPYLQVHTQVQSYSKLEIHPSDKLSNHFTPAGGAALTTLMLRNLVVQGDNCNVVVKLLACSTFGNCSCWFA